MVKEEKTFKQRVKQGTDVAMDWSKLMRGELNLTINLPEEDKKRLETKLDAMSDRIEKNWRITQIIMAVAVIAGVVGQVI